MREGTRTVESLATGVGIHQKEEKKKASSQRPQSRLLLEVGEALVEVVLGVLILGVLLELSLRNSAHEGGHAHLALHVHRRRVDLVLAP